MFTKQDAATFALPNGFDKLDKLGNTYFPQLGAMLIHAKKLIYDVYGIDVDARYYLTHAPINSKGRKEGVSFKASRNNTEQVSVGLRAKGEPKDLTKPDGSLCKMHFASLGFGVVAMDEGIGIGVGFDPYVLDYHQRHRDDFAGWIKKLHLDSAFTVMGIEPLSTIDFQDVPSLLRRRKAILTSQFIPGVSPSQGDIALMIVVFVGMFPFLDVFTRLSNAESVAGVAYAQQFHSWYRSKRHTFFHSFSIKPLSIKATKVAENKVRGYFETLLGYKFPTVRPDWLKSKTTGKNLELDGYCQELQLAFEYQGEYHYFPVLPHNKDKSVEDIQKNDAYKLKVCKRQGVSLIQVPYQMQGNQNYVVQALLGLNRPEINKLLGKTATPLQIGQVEEMPDELTPTQEATLLQQLQQPQPGQEPPVYAGWQKISVDDLTEAERKRYEQVMRATRRAARSRPEYREALRAHEEKVRNEVEARLGMLPREQVTMEKIAQVRRQVQRALAAQKPKLPE